MGIESMNRVNGGSYQGQGSSVSATTTVQSASQTSTEANVTDAPVKENIEITGLSTQDANGTKKIREEGQASNEQIKKAIEKINKEAQYNGEAIFGIHEATNRVTIKIVDKDTKKVIKEFPPEKTLDMIAKVWEMAGIMVDERR